MTARDDYPLLAAYAAEGSDATERAALGQALNEIDRLREKLNRALDLLAEDDSLMARFMGLA